MISAVGDWRAGARIALELSRRAAANPLAWILWLPLQLRYMQSTERFRLLRAGNQALGKTTAALADLLLDALGEHPYRQCDQSGEYWVICASWSQSVAIQAKLHALLPADRVRAGTHFTPSRGFRGKHPSVEVRHRDGGWSIIRFKTTLQGSLNLAGATIRGALFDEVPATQGVYSEVVKRVMAQGGWVAIGMTPVGAPVEWIRLEARAGRIQDIHSELTPDQLVPVGSTRPRQLPDGTVCDAGWIAQIIAETPDHEVPVRVHGGWEFRSRGNYFDGAWNQLKHIHPNAPTVDVQVLIGIDHGDAPGKQCAVLLAVDESGEYPRVYALDEYTDPVGTASPAEDAEGILAMLGRHGLQWSNLDWVGGDRVHLPGSGQQKSNRDLQVQIAKRLRLPPDGLLPPIRTVKRGPGRGAGSLTVGSRWLYLAMVAGRFHVHPRCKKLIASIPKYILKDDGNKDIIDAVRYALDQYIFGVHRRGPTPVLRMH